MKWFDLFAEHTARSLSRRTSRRSFLGTLWHVHRGLVHDPPVAGRPRTGGQALVGRCAFGSQLLRLLASLRDRRLPVRLLRWKFDELPPGTEMSAVTWIGTCHNPADGRDYVISYNDCCGKTSCGRCFCNRNERDTPLYQPGQSNDYDWCSGNSKANVPYHCSTARIVGAAE